MKRISRIVSLLLLCGAVSLQVAAQNQTDAKGRKQGAWKKTYSNGKTQYEGTFKDDCEQGTFRYYNKDGSLKQTIEYAGDCKSGYSKVFYRNGKVMSEGRYLNKQKDGLWVFYSADGKKLSQENYLKGKKEGTETIWDTKGNVLETIFYKNGKKQGEHYIFLYDQGSQIFTYKDDIKEGAYRNYYENKKVRIAGNYSKDKKQGTWNYLDEAGAKIRIQQWRSGELLSDKLILRERKGEREVESRDIAYLYPLGKQTCVVLSNGEKLTCFNYFDQILDCTDGDVFVRLNKKNNLYANYAAIKGVKDLSKDESEVLLEPKTDITVVADPEGMKALRSILDKSPLKK